MIYLDTIAEDLKALSDSELERLQLAVNGEYAARIQDSRATRRMAEAISEAQSVGFTDSMIDEVIQNARVQARGPRDEASSTPRLPSESAIIGQPNPGGKPTNNGGKK